jgi:hypothetical protein
MSPRLAIKAAALVTTSDTSLRPPPAASLFTACCACFRSGSVQVLGRLDDDASRAPDGRRPKSAKARNRGMWGCGRATAAIVPTNPKWLCSRLTCFFERGVDLRGLPLVERKRDLRRLCTKSRVPFLKKVEHFPDGRILYEHCDCFGFEGVVSKKLNSRYESGPSTLWQKSKCPSWRLAHVERWRAFEKPQQIEEQKALIKKRQELARVVERLADPDLRSGLARELHKLQLVLEREIAVLETTSR